MIFESMVEVDLINKLIGVVGSMEEDAASMTVDEFNTATDILRKASASFINREDRNSQELL